MQVEASLTMRNTVITIKGTPKSIIGITSFLDNNCSIINSSFTFSFTDEIAEIAPLFVEVVSNLIIDGLLLNFLNISCVESVFSLMNYGSNQC